MAPNYPDEVDVFTVPHSRMKELVHKYLDMVSSTNFRDVGLMTSVLEKLCHTFHEFKTHEQIENRFIMRRLKEKLTALSITDAAVCNCHSDNRLTEMLSLVLEGYRWARRSEHERVNYGLRLRCALEDFTQVFLPHMKEEEEVFQPMLIEYFTYDELKELKMKVIQKHQEKAEESEKALSEAASKEEDPEEESQRLPDELKLNIFSYLSPLDLARCAQVSNKWNRLALDPSLWPEIHPVQWAQGDWSFHPTVPEEDEEDLHGEGDVGNYIAIDDEDADVDESTDSEGSDAEAEASLQQALREVRIISGLVRHVLKRVGSGVHICNLAHSRGISSSLVHKILKLCPNLQILNLAHTRITDAAFREYGLKGRVCQLQHLDLTGCENITDATLYSLAGHPAWTQNPSPALAPSGSSPPDGGKGQFSCDRGFAPTTQSVISLSPPSVPENQNLPDPGCEMNETETLSLTFTDLSVLELCDFDCFESLCSQGSGDGKDLTVTGRSCCQTRDIFASQGDKNQGGRDKKMACLSGGNGMVEVANVPRTRCSGGGKCGGVDTKDKEEKTETVSDTRSHSLHRLHFLSLNGCFRIQDDGLRVLSERGGLPSLQHLDLSGCLNLTGAGVAQLVQACPVLDHSHLFYCDNLYPDPFPTTASGCRNLQCSTRFCCRSGE